MIELEHVAGYAADVPTVLAVLTCRDFLDDYAAQIGGLSHTAAVARDGDTLRTRVELTVATAGIPRVLQRFVGETATVVDMRSWPPADQDGSVSGLADVHVTQGGRTARLWAAMTLEPAAAPTSSRLRVRGELTIDIPLVAARAEALVRPLLLRTLQTESSVLERWLREGRAPGG